MPVDDEQDEERCHCGRPGDEAWGGTCGNDWCIAWERSMRGGMAR